jgi:flagellar biosynthesis protein FlhF
MRLKTYNTDSVQAALRLARIELGEEAVLIGSTKNPKGGSGAKLSVTFGTDLSGAEVERITEPLREPLENVPALEASPDEHVLEELRRLRSDLDWMRKSPRQSGAVESAFTPVFENKLVGQLFVRLVTRGVSPALAARLAAELEAGAEPEAPYHALLERLYSRVRSMWKVRAEPTTADSRQTVAVVGPAGAGKTSTLAKIAISLGFSRGRSIGFVCVDPFRVGGVDHLEAYAGLLDAPLRLVDRPEDLAAAVDEIRSGNDVPDLLLLDTAGYPLRDAAKQRSLHEALRQCGEVDVHLTLNATNRPEDIRRGYDAFGASASSLIFTRLDEASAPGSLLDESLRFGLPIAYVTTGQRTAQDLSPADPDELTMLAMGGVDVEPAFA